jgi:LysM domain-containing protein
MPRGISAPETRSQLAPTSEPPVFSAPSALPPSGQIPVPAPVTPSAVPTPSTEARDKQLDILTQAVNALHQEVARNDTRSLELLTENKRLRAEVDSLLRDLSRSRDVNHRVKKKLQTLQERLREIAEIPPLAAPDQPDRRGTSAEIPPRASSDAAKQEHGSAAHGVASGEPTRGRGLYHVVAAGETLLRIATAYGVDYRDLARENGIEDSDHIEVGQRIFIPGATRAP